MTKEEILKDKYFKEIEKAGQDKMYANESWVISYKMNSCFTRSIQSAMEEYAKDVAIDYLNWVDNEYINPASGSEKGSWFYNNGELAAKNTEELFNVYLKDKQKQSV